MENLNNDLNPSRCILWAGEVSSNYLHLNWEKSCVASGLKVASYVLTVGVLPLVAYVIHRIYESYQFKSYLDLQEKAGESFDGALWVSKNIQRFRIHSDYGRKQIAGVAGEQISKGYENYLEKYKDDNWLANYKLDQRDHCEIVYEMAKAIDKVDKTGDTIANFMKNLSMFALPLEELTFLYKNLAVNGIVADKKAVTKDQSFDIVLQLAKSFGHSFGWGLIVEKIEEFELNETQRFQIVQEMIKKYWQVFTFDSSYKVLDRFNLNTEQWKELILQMIDQVAKKPSDQYRESNIDDIFNICDHLKLSRKLLAPIVQKLISIKDLNGKEGSKIMAYVQDHQPKESPKPTLASKLKSMF
jgi:hypothetical protein